MSDIDTVLTRGVSQILPSREGLKKLMSKKKITLYQGFDPTAPSLHIGHFIGIRKLAEFQKLGHKVIFLIGDFTGLIGDPTDKSAARKKQTRKEVLENLKLYKDQVSKIISFEGENKAEVKFNSEWLSKLSFEEILELASNFTVQQMVERDMFQNRIREKKPIYLHEFFYPLMQGYDSVAMSVDLEVGGNDQLFNMLAGRALMKTLKNKEKFVLSMKLLTDTQGKKMGKSEGNAVNLSDQASDIYGKILSWPDSFIDPAIELLTDLPLDYSKGADPLTAKKTLAFEIVSQVKSRKEAENAEEHFEETFQKKTPSFEKEVTIEDKNTLLSVVSDVVGSNSEAKRLILQGAVDVNGIKTIDVKQMLKGGEKIKIGKRFFGKVKKT